MFKNINNILTLTNEPLKKHCTFKIGGEAKYFVFAHTVDALLDVIYTCQQHDLKHKIIGGGSNLLFDDLGYNGVIIKYDNSFVECKDNLIYTSCGADLSSVTQCALSNNLGGLEFTIGVPAQVGGAIVNNLGAYGSQISHYLQSITILKNKHLIYLDPKDCDFNYHSSIFQHQKATLLSAIFILPPQDRQTSLSLAKQYLTKRSSTQPLTYSNAGSVFKRTADVIPAKLIDDAGLKGLHIGDAEVSALHSGFIINKGNATSKDVLKLIEIIKQKVYEKYTINLQLEIEYLSF